MEMERHMQPRSFRCGHLENIITALTFPCTMSLHMYVKHKSASGEQADRGQEPLRIVSSRRRVAMCSP